MLCLRNLRKFRLIMSCSELDVVIANNKLAEQTLAFLKRELSTIKNDEINSKIGEIEKENIELRKQVEIAKQQLIKLEIANGKKQINLPASNNVSNSVSAREEPKQAPQPTAAPPKTESENADKKGQKKEKPKKEKAPAPEKEAIVEVIDVSRFDLRVGKIVEVSRHPDADSLYLEKIDVGEDKPRTVVSGLVKFVPIEEMENRMVVVMCNLKPAKMRGITSEAMVMCASTPEKVEVMSPPEGAVPGDLITCEGYERKPDLPFMNPKKKIFETVAPDMKVNDNLVATYKGAQLVVVGKGPMKSQTLKNVNIK